MSVTALASWFGSNRLLAKEVGSALDGCNWVGVVFAGSMCEVPHIKARTLMINDAHRHLINLAEVAADGIDGPRLYRRLRRRLFHPEELMSAQAFCWDIEAGLSKSGLFGPNATVDRIDWAEAYFGGLTEERPAILIFGSWGFRAWNGTQKCSTVEGTRFDMPCGYIQLIRET